MKRKPDESRLDLMQKNIRIIEQIMGDITSRASEAVVVMTTNPVDVLTYAALQITGWPRNRIFGTGTVLDSARFRYLLGEQCGVDINNVHAYILGEHGDSEVAAWSMAHLGGMPIDQVCPACGDGKETRDRIVAQVRNSGHHIIDAKGSTCYAIGLALVRIVSAILRNEHSILTVSVLLEGEYGLKDVCLSVPCIVSESGVERVIEGKLADEEMQALHASAAVITASLAELELSGS